MAQTASSGPAPEAVALGGGRGSRLRGRSVLVVGASSGLGRAVVVAAAAEGASLTLAARRSQELDAVAAGCAASAAVVRCDVTDADDCRQTVDSCVERFGALDALVYSAGCSPLGPMTGITAAEWDQLFRVNTIGAALIMGWAAPHLRASRGRAIFMSSAAARALKQGLIPYGASKRALEAIVDGYRIEEPEIAFTTVVIASTGRTEFSAGWDRDLAARYDSLWKQAGLLTRGNFASEETFAELMVSILAADVAIPEVSVGPLPM